MKKRPASRSKETSTLSAATLKFNLSPSRLARFYYHECQRYLRFHATPTAARKGQGVPGQDAGGNRVTQAILARGYEWEEEVLKGALKERALVARGKGPLRERAFTVPDTLSTLRSMKSGQWIYQPTLSVPGSFLEHFGLEDLCEFRECRPDLLTVNGKETKNQLRVVDIKASNELKPSHRIQTALYALILDEIIKEDGMPLDLDTAEAGIWLYGHPGPEHFDLGPSLRLVRRFLKEELRGILESPLHDLHWHLHYRCELCEYFGFCKQEAVATNSVSLLPGLSVGGRRYLRGAPSGKKPVNSLDDLKGFLKGKNTRQTDEILAACGNLRGRRLRLQKAVRAIQENEIVPHGTSCLCLPKNESVQIVLTLQSDPHSGQTYAAGILRGKGTDVYGSGQEVQTFVAAGPDDCGSIQRSFLSKLHGILEQLHQYNSKREWKDQKSLQVYVFDSNEYTLFSELMLEGLKDATLAPTALRLLFHFQDEQLAGMDEHPVDQVPHPVVVVTRAIRELVSLPSPFVVRLPETHNALRPVSTTFTYDAGDLFWSEMSNSLKSDSIFMAWHGGRADAIGWVETEIAKRLRATSTVIEGLRERVGSSLFAWPQKFLFPALATYANPEISRLAFIARYEAFMRAIEVREARARSPEERLEDATSVEVMCVGGTRWKVTQPQLADSIEGDDFPRWLIVPDDDAGEQAQLGHNDFARRNRLYSEKNRGRWVAAVTDVESTPVGVLSYLTVKINGTQPFTKGSRAVLHTRFTDFTTDKVLRALAAVDGDKKSAFLQLLREPTRYAAAVRLPKAVSVRVKGLAGQGFTKSQSEAFSHLAKNLLTLVWGPPGTGKTYFLARAILSLVEAHGGAESDLRIAVTAFTHAAIENLLLEMLKVQKESGLARAVRIAKLDAPRTGRGHELDWVSKERAGSLGAPTVVGATVYALDTAMNKGGMAPVDLLVVDEASQMKFGELALAHGCLEPGGRLVLAGDDLQLPPIISGAYPEREDGLPDLHDSVFAYLRARDDETKPYTWQLNENWRMNAELNRFPVILYGPDYVPATPEIAKRRVRLGSGKPSSDVAAWLLDPAYPLAVCVMHGIQAAQENPVEARIVAGLAGDLRRRLLTTDGKPFKNSDHGDAAFWRDGLFIVSPHHAQIRTINVELAKVREWKSTPFVDTVDKMQGQQSQVVLVSYGVSDAETALGEATFIYSLNRLNVSITRAKAKCVVFLSRPLLEPSLELLRDARAEEGLGFMQALVDHCAEGEAKTWQLTPFGGSPQATLKTYRVGC